MDESDSIEDMGEENIVGRGESDEDVFFVLPDVIESVEEGDEIDDPAEDIKIQK